MTSMPPLPDADAVRSITCLNLGEIGDLVVSVPTIHALKSKYPKAHLKLVARQQVISLIANDPHIDEIMPYPSGHVFGRLRMVWNLWRLPCDLWVDLHTETFNTFGSMRTINQRNALLMTISNARYQRAFVQPDRRCAITHPICLEDISLLKSENIVDTTLRLADVEPKGALYPKKLFISDQDGQWAQDFMRARGLKQENVIGLFVGAKQSAKFWPLDNVLDFCLNILQQDALNIIVFGGPHEQAHVSALVELLPNALRGKLYSLVQSASLMQTAAMMRECKLVVSTDSGPMHMAEALGIPLIALMSSHNYVPIWQPQARNATVINVPVACGPCLESTCGNDNLCMRSIAASDVVRMVNLRMPSANAC
jgi:heptosyltransferase II